MVGLDGLLVALERIVRLVQCGHGGLELGANALHVKVLGRMQQLMAPLVGELNGIVDLLDAHGKLAHVHSDVMHGNLLLCGAIWWFKFYYARPGRRRIRKRVRVRLTRTRSLGAVCVYHTIRGCMPCVWHSGERCETAHGRQTSNKRITDVSSAVPEVLPWVRRRPSGRPPRRS